MALYNGTGYFAPYFGDSNSNGAIDSGEQFAKPQSFQIISAGQDGIFGTSLNTPAAVPPVSYTFFRMFPSGVGYDKAGTDDDNVTSFNEKNNLDAAKP